MKNILYLVYFPHVNLTPVGRKELTELSKESGGKGNQVVWVAREKSLK